MLGAEGEMDVWKVGCDLAVSSVVERNLHLHGVGVAKYGMVNRD